MGWNKSDKRSGLLRLYTICTKEIGIYIPRTSRAQSRGGKRVSMNNIQPGDLIFYRNGVVNHVAMYIATVK